MSTLGINKSWILTHSYDKCLSNELMEKIKPMVLESSIIIKKDKLRYFEELRRKIINNVIALKYYDKMIYDYIEDNNNNYDPINNLDTIDLLYIVYKFSIDNDIISLLIEQLKDMQTGFCPQGRTIRLIQIIQPYLH